ncbi:Phosphoethanolamine transferase CptA [Trichinella pseudospiralis]
MRANKHKSTSPSLESTSSSAPWQLLVGISLFKISLLNRCSCCPTCNNGEAAVVDPMLMIHMFNLLNLIHLKF